MTTTRNRKRKEYDGQEERNDLKSSKLSPEIDKSKSIWRNKLIIFAIDDFPNGFDDFKLVLIKETTNNKSGSC